MAERFHELKKAIQGFTRDERERRRFDPVLLKEAEPVPAQDTLDQLLKRLSALEEQLSGLQAKALTKEDLPPVSVDGKTINPLYCMLRTSDTSLALTTKPVNSKGHSFGTIQAAVDDLAGDGFVYVPPGTYHEAVILSDDYVELYGAGWSSHISGGVIGTAVTVSGDYCMVHSLQVSTTAGGGNLHFGVSLSGSNNVVRNVYVSACDHRGMAASGTDNLIIGCHIAACDGSGMSIGQARTRVFGNYIDDTVDTTGQGDDSVIIGNYITGASTIHADSENCVWDGNRNPGGLTDNSGTSTVGDNDET